MKEKYPVILVFPSAGIMANVLNRLKLKLTPNSLINIDNFSYAIAFKNKNAEQQIKSVLAGKVDSQEIEIETVSIDKDDVDSLINSCRKKLDKDVEMLNPSTENLTFDTKKIIAPGGTVYKLKLVKSETFGDPVQTRYYLGYESGSPGGGGGTGESQGSETPEV